MLDGPPDPQFLRGPRVTLAAAIRAYGKVGFRPVGRLRAHERGPDGTWSTAC